LTEPDHRWEAGEELGGLRREPAAAWELDGLVHSGSDRGLASGTADNPRRPTVVFAAGDPDSADMTTNDVDDASQLDPLLDQVEGPVASFTGDGAYDQDNIYRTVIDCDPDAAVVVPPRATAVLSETAETGPTQRDRHLQCIAERGRMGWQTAAGYNKRSRVETAIGRYKQVIGDGLRFRTDGRRATEVGVAALVLNRMQEFGRPISVRIK
jgi:hypothetical protein